MQIVPGTKLSKLCLEISWDRPNSGVLCINPLGHEGSHCSDRESFGGGKGDQNLHDTPELIPHFLYLLGTCVDDITPKHELSKMRSNELVAYWNIIQMDKRMIGGGPGLLEPYVDAILTERGIAHESDKLTMRK